MILVIYITILMLINPMFLMDLSQLKNAKGCNKLDILEYIGMR